MSHASAFEGMVAADHPLSTRTGFNDLGLVCRSLVQYSPQSLWELENRRLPARLVKWRRHVRDFAETHMRPQAADLDAAPHPEPGEMRPGLHELFVAAAKAGLMTDLMPMPLGTSHPRQTRRMVWAQALKTEELSRVSGGQMLALCAPQLGLAPIALSGDIRAIQKFALPVNLDPRRGEPHICAFAITEPQAGSDAEEGHGASLYRPGVVARKEGNHWVLNGRKVFISGGDIAKTLTVFAAIEGEGMASWTCFVVLKGMPGFNVVRTELKMGMRASGAAELEFDNVRVPESHIVGGLRKGWALNRATLNFSRLPVAAMAVGFAQSALDIAMDYVVNHRLGGRRLLDFQEVQLTLAQMVAETTAIRALVWQQCGHFTPRQAGASIGKFYATDAAVRVCDMAMDLLGEHSLDAAQQLEKVFRDVRLTQIFEGTNQINRLAVIEDMQEELLSRML